MTRATAREIAVQLCFAASANTLNAAELVDGFLDKEYYSSLNAASELYEDYPGAKQRDYIRGIVLGVEEHR